MNYAYDTALTDFLSISMSRHDEKTITNIFPNAITLYNYLLSCIDNETAILLENDSDSYKKMLQTSMIVPESVGVESKFTIPTIRDKISIKEALNGIIAKLVRQNQSYRDQNCLAFGYRQKSSSQAVAMRSNFDVECYFVNTVLPMLSSRMWEQLANRIGEAILYHIFQRPLFVLSKNGCYLQVSGTSTSELVYQLNKDASKFGRTFSDTAYKRGLSSIAHEIPQSPKLRRTTSTASIDIKRMNTVSSGITLVDGNIDAIDAVNVMQASAFIPRYKLFYRSNQQQKVGLPSNHILNKVLSGDALVYSVFKPILHQVKSSEHHAVVHQNLVNLMRTIATLFKTCDLPLLLHLHCPIKLTPDKPVNDSAEVLPPPPSLSTPVSITLGQQDPCPSSLLSTAQAFGTKGGLPRKTRRGCRAGKQVKQRGHSQSTGPLGGLLLLQSQQAVAGLTEATPVFNRHNTAGYYFDDFHYESQELTPEEALDLSRNPQKAEIPLTQREEEYEGVGECVPSTQSTAVADDQQQQQQQLLLPEQSLLAKAPSTESNSSGRNKLKKLKRKQRKEARRTNSLPSGPPPLVAAQPDEPQTQRERAPRAPLQLPEAVNLLTLHSSHAQVASFVKAVLVKSLPWRQVWGTRRNQAVVLRCLTEYIALGRHETVSLVHVTQGIQTSDIPWLQFVASEGGDNDTRTSRLDSLLQQQLLLAFVNWLYCEVIHPLLTTSFYITEIDGHKFDCCYYRQPVWSLIVRKGMVQMNSNFSMCDPFNAVEGTTSLTSAALSGFTNGGRTLKRTSTAGSTTSSTFESPAKKFRRMDSLNSDPGTTSGVVDTNVLDAVRRRNYLQRIPRVRFVPKKNSVRALTNLKSNFKGGAGANSAVGSGEVLTNSALFNCLHVLKHMYQSNPLAGGFGTFGIDDIYLKFRKYVGMIHQLQEKQQQQLYVPQPFLTQPPPDVHCSSGSMTLSGLTGSPSQTSVGGIHTNNGNTTATRSQKFFMAVLDLEKCYDNINKEFLFDIVQKLLLKNQQPNGIGHTSNGGFCSALQRSHSTSAVVDSTTSATAATAGVEGAHLIHRYTVSHAVPSLDKTLTKTVRHVSSSEEIVSFQEASEEISRCYRNSIITDGVVYNRVTNQEVLKLLHTHLFSHTVKIPTDTGGSIGNGYNKRQSSSLHRSASVDRGTAYQCYRQIKGIPQGSILSPLLCNIYYGHVENDLFNNIFSIEILGLSDRSVIIRLIDDYIMISTEQSCVQHFLQMVHVNLKPYGGGVNPLKTRVNFDTSIDIGGKQIELHNIHSHLMPFCGLFVNTSTLEITPNLGRFFERPIGSSIVVEYARSGSALRKAIKSYIRTKCDAILLDRSLNRKSTVLSTLYSMYLLAGMRTHNFVTKVRAFGAVMSPSCLYSCITEGLLFGARLLHVRTKRKKCKVLHISSNREDGEDDVIMDREVSEDQCDLSMDGDGRSLFERCISTVVPSCFGTCELSLEESLWVGLTAFIKVLSHRKSLYMACIRMLKSKLGQIESTLKKRNQLPSCQILYSCDSVLQSVSWM